MNSKEKKGSKKSDQQLENTFLQLDEKFVRKILGRKCSVELFSWITDNDNTDVALAGNVPFKWELKPGKPKEEFLRKLDQHPSLALLLDKEISRNKDNIVEPISINPYVTTPCRLSTTKQGLKNWFWKKFKKQIQIKTLQGDGYDSNSDTTTIPQRAKLGKLIRWAL